MNRSDDYPGSEPDRYGISNDPVEPTRAYSQQNPQDRLGNQGHYHPEYQPEYPSQQPPTGYYDDAQSGDQYYEAGRESAALDGRLDSLEQKAADNNRNFKIAAGFAIALGLLVIALIVALIVRSDPAQDTQTQTGADGVTTTVVTEQETTTVTETEKEKGEVQTETTTVTAEPSTVTETATETETTTVTPTPEDRE